MDHFVLSTVMIYYIQLFFRGFFKHKFVLFLKIRTEVVCIVMRDRDARAGIALKLIFKAGNAKYYHPTHNFYNLLLIY